MSSRLAFATLLLTACASPASLLGQADEKDTGLEPPVEFPDTGWGPSDDYETCSILVTRDAAFWGRSELGCTLEGEATGYSLLPVTVGTGGRRLTFATASDVRRYLTSTSPSAHVRLGQQILAAKLNLAAFPWIADLAIDDYGPFPIATAEAAYDSGNDAQVRNATTTLATVNASGAAEPLWFDPTCVREPELCNGADDDGDGEVDEDCGCL